ncbi:tetratricopeptide repeat-containing sensor histidine kinase [uncultured Eudoraea sp.]|uniref:tetratricopeptide repeat-containing sensor histidine kinase n=1 Tax=uncultured Eudoraea sp. TaxID=1035614 RepID=UPI002630EF91|nr:tetratricopeptide repeat-containing sensor histidine kinase [uncultured Eudoraea sp.]
MPLFLTYIRKLCNVCMTYIVIAILLLCGNQNTYGQQKKQEELKDSIRDFRANKNFSPKDTLYIDLLNKLGSELRYYNTDSLLLLSEEALQLSLESGYREGECRSRLRLGDYYSDKGDSDKAISYYAAGHEIAEELGNKDLSLRIINNLAGENAYKGDYASALTGYLQGIEIAEEIGNQSMLSIMNENIANLYASQKDYTQSLDFYKKVKKINGELGDEVIMAETLSNLASVYADMGKLDYAMFNINKSIAIFEKHKILDWLAFTYEIKGKVYLKENKYKWALYWYNQSEMLHKNLDDDRGKIDLFNGMAEAFLGQGKDSISENFAQQAYEISDRIQFLEGTQKCAFTLYRINKNKKSYVNALKFHELYQQLSDTLSRNENKKSLTMLKTKTEYDNQKQMLIEENEKALAEQQRYVNAALVILMIFMVVTYVVHRGQKIQKHLNSELQAKQVILEKREIELENSNETKTKLFSIIGHDLRGPVGALQELLRLYSDGDIDTEEFLEFVPKLKEDVDHISFTLNNLLSWGHTQMNGAVTKPSLMALESLVSENIKLLSEIAKKKSIKIVSELTENTLTWSDSNQIDIVVRNLISNALKFTPQNGMITISARERDNLWEVSIKDTGVGMDKITVKNLFEKNSNITTYGTNNEKGTGLGLSLCKEMVEKNGGSIWVESALRKGSCFFFTLPKREKSYSQAV